MNQEPLYEFVKGQGWVVQTGSKLTVSEYYNGGFEKWVCVKCNAPIGHHFGNSNDSIITCDRDRNIESLFRAT